MLNSVTQEDRGDALRWGDPPGRWGLSLPGAALARNCRWKQHGGLVLQGGRGRVPGRGARAPGTSLEELGAPLEAQRPQSLTFIRAR